MEKMENNHTNLNGSVPKEEHDNIISSSSSTSEEDLARRTQQQQSEAYENGDPSQDSFNQSTLEAAGGDRPPLNRVVSVNNVAAIPNGGTVAWLQVLGSFFLFLNSWGIVNTFGVYQTYYEQNILSSQSPSTISWIGSIQAFLLMLVGALTGPIYDAGYFRALLAVGSFLVVFGHMMLSLCTEYWQVLLAQGICVGLGCGCLFVPSVAILSTYFTTKVAFAMGMAASGSSLGGIIYPIVLYRLFPRIGFGWATRVVGFLALAGLIVANLLMKVRVLPASRRKIVDWHAWREAPYTLFILGAFIGFVGLYTPFFYIQTYGITSHITDERLGFYLLPILNAASVFGRIVPNIAADKVGPMNMIIPCCIISGVLSLCLIPVNTLGPLIAVAIFYGFFSGSFVSLPPTILVHLSPNRGIIGTRMGMCFTVMSFGVLIGTPISGAILNARGFTSMWIFSGVVTGTGGFVILMGRVAKAGWKVTKWV